MRRIYPNTNSSCSRFSRRNFCHSCLICLFAVLLDMPIMDGKLFQGHPWRSATTICRSVALISYALQKAAGSPCNV